MLDGQRYFSEFPDEEQPAGMLLSQELLVTLKAIEKEISAFIRGDARVVDGSGAGDCRNAAHEVPKP